MIFCDGDPNWRPDRYEDHVPGTTIQFQYSTVKLLDYEQHWAALNQSQNPFAIVVKAHLKTQATKRRMKERRQWKFTLIREMYERGYSAQDVINLFRFIDWIMVLSEEADALFWEQLEVYEETQTMPYITSVERIGIRRGKADTAIKQLNAKFGEVSPKVTAKIQKLSADRLDELAIALLNFETVEHLTDWLNQSAEGRDR